MEKLLKKLIEEGKIKKALDVLNDLSNSLNAILVKSNDINVLPEIEVENIYQEWKKFKKESLENHVFCERYILKKMESEGENFDFRRGIEYTQQVRAIVKSFKENEETT